MKLVTITPNKKTGDRSYTDKIWEMIGTNGTHTRLRDPNYDESEWSREFIIIVNSEHDISDAKPLDPKHCLLCGRPIEEPEKCKQ